MFVKINQFFFIGFFFKSYFKHKKKIVGKIIYNSVFRVAGKSGIHQS